MRLEKLARIWTVFFGEVQGTVAGLKPGLVNMIFDSLNQTLAQRPPNPGSLDDVLLELKQYPSGFLFGNPPSRVKEVSTI